MKALEAFIFMIGIATLTTLSFVSGQQVEDESNVEQNNKRNVTAVINPKCPDTMCVNFTLIHVQQRGRTDVLHHIWTMEKVPSLFYARTDLDAELFVDWEALISANHSPIISFSKEPQYFAAVMISKFLMFNDLNDTGLLPVDDDNSSHIASFDTRQMHWRLDSLNSSTNTLASAVFKLSTYQGVELDSTTNVQITLTAYGSRARSSILPHLAFTENSTQLDLVFDNVLTGHSFPNPRLAVEIATIVSEPGSRFSVNVSRSLDDEYTPGVFKLMEVRSAEDQHWMQWRPVCYTSIKRDIADSTGLTQTQIWNVTDEALLDDSLLAWINLGADFHGLSVQGFNLTLGTSGDGFYSASNYTAWTMVTGHGKPVEDRFSLMVILVMAVGLGLPAVVLFIGGLAIAIRNYRMKKDDLLLSN